MKSSVLVYSSPSVKVYHRELGKTEQGNTGVRWLMSQKTGAVIHSLPSNLDFERSSNLERSFCLSVLQIHRSLKRGYAALPF